MHDLKTNFAKFQAITKQMLKNELKNGENLQYYPNPPKMSDVEVISLSLCAESLSIDSENHLWSKLKKDYHKEFPNLSHLTRYNKRKKRLKYWINEVNQRLSAHMNEGEDIWIVDSIPVPVCKLSREHQLKICRQDFQTAPDKGYSAVNKQYYLGYKLHLMISLRGVYHSMDLSKASVHDIHFLHDIKQSGLNNATLLADKGYLNASKKIDLFNTSNIKLCTPKRKNQTDYGPYPYVFRKSRKRIETLFAQLCDQMMLKRNYAKTVEGLSTRIVCKITAVTCLQYINMTNNRPLNHIKHALAA